MSTAPSSSTTSATGSPAGRVRKWAGLVALVTWLPVLLVGAWWLAVRSSTDIYFPPLEDILSATTRDWLGDRFLGDVVPSLACLAAGLGIATVAGLTGGLLLGTVKPAREILAPILDLFRATPAISLIPIFLSILGIGATSEIALIAWASVWPILLNATDGVAGVDPGYRDVARVLRLSTRARLSLVTFRAASPQIMAGLNTSIGLGVVAMVAVEMFSSERGIGYQLVLDQRNFSIASTYGDALVAGLVGYGLAALFAVLQRRVVLRWQFEQGAQHAQVH
jgi:ABC-type nitrate/sulfonate/bicarbonate transport system permease component